MGDNTPDQTELDPDVVMQDDDEIPSGSATPQMNRKAKGKTVRFALEPLDMKSDDDMDERMEDSSSMATAHTKDRGKRNVRSAPTGPPHNQPTGSPDIFPAESSNCAASYSADETRKPNKGKEKVHIPNVVSH